MTSGGVLPLASPAAAATPTLSAGCAVRAVSRRFGRHAALDGVTLTVQAGTTFALLGPNGSGKTTLLRILAGVLRPDSGDVVALGASPRDRDVRARIGFMAQVPALHPVLSLYENIRLFAGLQGVRSRADLLRAVDAVALTEDIHRPIEQLSLGMQRRASFACTIAHRPRLLLLDEPTVGVDPQVRRAFWQQFEQMNAAGVAIVISTHIMEEAARCDALAVLREGRVIAAGTPSAIVEQQDATTLEDAYLRMTEAAS